VLLTDKFRKDGVMLIRAANTPLIGMGVAEVLLKCVVAERALKLNLLLDLILMVEAALLITPF